MLKVGDLALRKLLLLGAWAEQTKAFPEEAPSGGTVEQRHRGAAPCRCL